MKKHVFVLSIMTALLLSLCASSWAAVGYNIDSFTSAYSTIYSIDAKADYAVSIVLRTEVSKKSGNQVLSADAITWTVSNDGALTRCKLVDADDPTTDVYTEDISDMKDDETKTYRLRLRGNIAQAGTVTVTATLTGDSIDKTSGTSTRTVSIVFSTESADKISDVTDSTHSQDVADSFIAEDTDTHDPRDPDSEEWNGLQPPYSFDVSGDVSSGVKPKVSWPKPSDFTSGVSTDTIVATITGPVEGINVYVAAKDAFKLYGNSHKIAKKEAVDIPLTSANVKLYNIPFRVTVIDSSKNVATGIKNTDKNAETKVTIAFNGGNYAYKKFPLTLSAWNKNNVNKPASKTVKLNVIPNTEKPVWGILTAHEDGTIERRYSTSSLNTWVEWQQTYEAGTTTSGDTTTKISYGYNSNFRYILVNDATDTKPLEVQYYRDPDGSLQRYEFPNTDIYGNIDVTSQKLISGDPAQCINEGSGIYYEYEQRGKYWYVGVVPTFYRDESVTVKSTSTNKPVTVYTFESFDKKNQPDDVEVLLYQSSDKSISSTSFYSPTYSVKAAAPYAIPIPKSMAKQGISIDVTQPKFDYLGRNTVSGSVYIHGTLTKKGKNSISLTAANPSTKKNAKLKVKVIGKLVKPSDYPSFAKTTSFRFDTSVLDVSSDAWFIERSSDYAAERQKLVTKYVTAGKSPSVKFKAKGAKTITYALGLYDANGFPDGYTAYYYTRSKFTGEPALWDYMYRYVIDHNLFYRYGYDFNDALKTELAAKGLSFDVKKKAIVLLDSSTKTTPTLNDAGDNFEAFSVAVTAMNSLGSAQVFADVGITGQKPKLAEKSVTISGAVKKGQVFTFKLMAGNVAAETVTDNSANVRSYTASAADAKVLSDWGLELVNYDSMDIIVSNDLSTDKAETLILKSGDKTAWGMISGDKDTYTGTNNSGDIVTKGNDGVTIVYWVGVKFARSKDVSYKNYGLIQVTDQEKLARVVSTAASADTKGKELKKLKKGSKINLILDNLGASGKGKLTVSLADNITNGGNPVEIANNGSSTTTTTTTAKTSEASVQKVGRASGLSGNGAAPEVADDESELETESTLTIEAQRTIANLTAGQRAYIEGMGYRVIAVLPEISSKVDGQQDIEAELDEDAPEGEEMIYIPFPKDSQETEDDSIVDFYDKSGAPIDEVPAAKAIVVSPWLRSGVTYEPVVAVKAAE